MHSMRWTLIALMSFAAGATVGIAAVSYDLPNRQELKHAELSGAPGMEVISSITEYEKGEVIPRHVHHGIEAAYVVQGAMVDVPGKGHMRLKTGESVLYLRDQPHGGITVVGNQPLKIFTVHIVDKGKPLYEWVKQP